MFRARLLVLGLSVIASGAAAQTRPNQNGASPDVGVSSFRSARGTPTRGPDLVVKSPKGPVTSPFALLVTFTPHNGAKIDPDSVTVTLQAAKETDLTERLRRCISARGLTCEAVDLPVGRATLRVSLADDAGHVGSATIPLVVTGR